MILNMDYVLPEFSCKVSYSHSFTQICFTFLPNARLACTSAALREYNLLHTYLELILLSTGIVAAILDCLFQRALWGDMFTGRLRSEIPPAMVRKV